MNTPLTRCVQVNGRNARLQVERTVWDALDEICAREGVGFCDVLSCAQSRHPDWSLARGVRAYVVDYFRAAVIADDPACRGDGDADSNLRGRRNAWPPVLPD